MKYERYPVVSSSDEHSYEFYSEGPKGKIRKTIGFTRIEEGLFNLGFGDWNEDRQCPDDSQRTNNGDRDKVLATVASAVLLFTDEVPNARIFIKGSTSARTRLYQMGIGYNLKDIIKDFEVFGFYNDQWERFGSGRNYEGFLVWRK